MKEYFLINTDLSIHSPDVKRKIDMFYNFRSSISKYNFICINYLAESFSLATSSFYDTRKTFVRITNNFFDTLKIEVDSVFTNETVKSFLKRYRKVLHLLINIMPNEMNVIKISNSVILSRYMPYEYKERNYTQIALENKNKQKHIIFMNDSKYAIYVCKSTKRYKTIELKKIINHVRSVYKQVNDVSTDKIALYEV